jgi:NAD-dependent deacetylase
LVRGRSACLEEAIILTETADYFAVRTSLQVYPAAGLIDFTHSKLPYYIDPKPIKIPNLKTATGFSQVAPKE